MKFKSTIILATVLLGLGLYVYYIDIPSTEKAKKEKERSEKIIPFEKENAEEFTLSYADTLITMKTDTDQEWNMVTPIATNGDKKTADGIISRLQSITFSRIVDENPKDLNTYGLAKPSLTIGLKVKGEEKKTITVGDTTPLNNGVYVKREWEPKIFLAGTYIRDDLQKSVYELRDKSIIDIKKEDVKEVQLVTNNSDITLTNNQGKWTVSKPIQTDGDEDEIRSLITNIKKLEVKKFIEENAQDLAKYGLSTPKKSITVVAEKSNASKTLFIGKKDTDSYYAKRQNSNTVFLIGETDLNKIIKKDGYDLRNKKILSFDTGTIEKIELQYPDEHIVLQRGEKKDDREVWEVLRPISTKGNEAEISRLLSRLEEVEVKTFLSDSKEKLKKNTPDNTTLKFSLWKKDNTSVDSLTIGRYDEKKEGYLSTATKIDTTFLLERSDVDTLSKKLFDLRDRRLIDFDDEKVEKIQLEYAKKTIAVEKKGKNRWRIITPEKTAASETKVRVLLWNLRDIEFKKMVSDSLNTTDSYGLKKPSLEITVWQENKKDIKKLLFGNREGEENLLYAQNRKDGPVYGIDPEILVKIPKGTDDFVE